MLKMFLGASRKHPSDALGDVRVTWGSGRQDKLGGSWGCWGPQVPRGSLWGRAQKPSIFTSSPLNPQHCLQRILQGLQHYQAMLGSDIFAARPQPELKAVLEELLGLVQVSCPRPRS